MKIAFLAGYSSIHTVKWVNELARRGHNVHLITMHPGREELHKSVQVYILPFKPPLGYYLNVRRLKVLLRKIKPDILNTHYASGYGVLGRLCGFHPHILSVWGDDVYGVPDRSILFRKIITKNLCRADWICSTSKTMAQRVNELFPVRGLTVTPFGVNTEVFMPMPKEQICNRLLVGTVKALSPDYGIDTLIKAFAEIKNELSDMPGSLELLIVGDGPQRAEYEDLVHTLGIQHCTTFTGAVPHGMVPNYLNQLDIYVAASRAAESFGVAVVEASACGIPVIVSDAGGLPEVVNREITGIIVEKDDVEALAHAIKRLIGNEPLRRQMGAAGRRHVLDHYQWKQNADIMEDVYQQVYRDFRNNNRGV